jgi:hypothetical protein
MGRTHSRRGRSRGGIGRGDGQGLAHRCLPRQQALPLDRPLRFLVELRSMRRSWVVGVTTVVCARAHPCEGLLERLGKALCFADFAFKLVVAGLDMGELSGGLVEGIDVDDGFSRG